MFSHLQMKFKCHFGVTAKERNVTFEIPEVSGQGNITDSHRNHLGNDLCWTSRFLLFSQNEALCHNFPPSPLGMTQKKTVSNAVTPSVTRAVTLHIMRIFGAQKSKWESSGGIQRKKQSLDKLLLCTRNKKKIKKNASWEVFGPHIPKICPVTDVSFPYGMSPLLCPFFATRNSYPTIISSVMVLYASF